ncbi:hypothetical protein B0G71_5835 [Paraburkholderia sp. BL27I4N3]|uniref:DUF6447 family protein n=1 Tax=Paraburkholderia sp. BL27I4N3 TaxID=1938805 RepID=UPI000E2523D1|nr:DUF6447 family protein [Paraburkholderia sp. BL27I4N3]REE22618.1 hypothetical protein B0G71_5835 [Paraburkholderia sp. BL27I4N3]
MSLPEYITLNGTNYATAKLSAEAHAQVQNIQVVDVEIARLQQRLAIAQTARNAYSNALVTAVKGSASEVRAPEKKPRSPRKPKAKAE